MGLSRSLILFVTLAVSTLSLCAQSTPSETVKAFYRYDWSHSQIFNRRNLDARKKWLSPSLYRLFLSEVERERQHLKMNPTDKGYFGDGFPFQPLGEYFEVDGIPCRQRAYHVGRTKILGKQANVSVTFFYLPKKCDGSETYKIQLLRGAKGWQIFDVVYRDGSSLVADMKKHHY